MKQHTYGKTAVLALGLFLLATIAGTGTSQAQPRHNGKDHRDWKNHNRHYSHQDQRRHSRGGYYRYYAPREYVYYRNHRGYWEDRGGIRFFIRIN